MSWLDIAVTIGITIFAYFMGRSAGYGEAKRLELKRRHERALRELDNRPWLP